MPIWLQIVVALGIGGIVAGFWAWVRAQLLKISADVAVLFGWKETVEERCLGHEKNVQRIFDRIDGVKDAVAKKDSETARAIGCLEGKIGTLKGAKQ